MTYIDGFVLAVPTDNKDAYRDHAAQAAPLFREFGALRMVENWGDEVPEGKVTDFRRAVKAQEGEQILFSWVEYADKAARDAASQQIMTDPRIQEICNPMPFDGKRMIYAGFDPIVEEGAGGGGYIDGYLVAVPEDNKQAYRAMASLAAGIFRECGALRVVEAWGDDVPDGETTDFRRAVQAKPGEAVIFSFVEWPDKPSRDAGMARAMEDERMKPDFANMPFDGQRMIFGGFANILDA